MPAFGNKYIVTNEDVQKHILCNIFTMLILLNKFTSLRVFLPNILVLF